MRLPAAALAAAAWLWAAPAAAGAPDARAEAARLARLHEALVAHARRDPATRPVALERLAGRAWAYRAFVRLVGGETPAAVAAAAPDSSALRDLAYLLAQAPGHETAALEAVSWSRRAFVLGEDLLLEAGLRRRLGRSIDGDAAVVDRLLRPNADRRRLVAEARADAPAFGPVAVLPDPPGAPRLLPDRDAPVETPLEIVASIPLRPNPGGIVRLRAAPPEGGGRVRLVGRGPGGAAWESDVREVRDARFRGTVFHLEWPETMPTGPWTVRLTDGWETGPPFVLRVADVPPSAQSHPHHGLGPLRWRGPGETVWQTSPGIGLRPDGTFRTAPGVLLRLEFMTQAESIAAIIVSDAEAWAWLPARPFERFEFDGIPSVRTWWRVPANVPAGTHDFVWAGRSATAWGLWPGAVGRIEIVEEAPPPRLAGAAYHHEASGGARPGDLVVRSPDLFAGEWVRLAWTGGGREVRCETDGLVVWNLGDAPPPETVAVAAVALGRAGAWSEPVAVEIRGEPPPPPPPPPAPEPAPAPPVVGTRREEAPAARPPGVRAVEWFARVGRALERSRARLGRNPTEAEALAALRLEDVGTGLFVADTWPRSPWGGAWSYHPVPGGRTAAFLARDTAGRLAAEWSDGGVENGLVEYADLAVGAAVGEAARDLLWTPPWDAASLGPVVAEAVREAAGAEAALVPATFLAGNLPRGPVTEAHLDHAVPRDDRIVVLEVRGIDLAAAVIRGSADDAFRLHAAGVRLREPPRGGRWPSFEVVVERGGTWVPLADDAWVRLAVPAHLAGGGDGYVGLRAARSRRTLDLGVREALAARLRRLGAAPFRPGGSTNEGRGSGRSRRRSSGSRPGARSRGRRGACRS